MRKASSSARTGALAAGSLAVAAGFCLSGAASAQARLYTEVTNTHLPPSLAGPCMDAAAGDADGDGDLDLALAMEFQPNILLLNDGTGTFRGTSDRLPRGVHDSEDVAFADFDGDNDLDLVLVSEDDRTDELYINDGSGRFTDASMRLPTDDVSNALAVLDLDGDGAPDVLTGNIGTNRVLLNDGRGGFRDETEERWPQRGSSRTQDLELVDVDADGDQDVVVGNEGQNQMFLNEGGRFVDATARALPDRVDETREIRAADVDGDDDPDLFVANVRFSLEAPPRDYLLLNDGSGVFETAEASRFPEDARNNFTVQAIDLDRDGDTDVVAPSTDFSTTPAAGDYLVLLNDGSGTYSAAAQGSVLPESADGNGFDVEAADFDGDGVTDLFLCNRASNAAAGSAAATGGQQRLLLGARVPE
ncbi:MAG: VCBS repeat-containing protein [Gammaproteobacteria bacterium]|nr:VCBS repeat-containing protein [Gammaproteobacteria bacterium]